MASILPRPQCIKQCSSSDRCLYQCFRSYCIQEALQLINFIMSCYFNPICLQPAIWFSLINDSMCTGISIRTGLLGNGKTSNITDVLLLRTSCQIMEHFCKGTLTTSSCTLVEWTLLYLKTVLLMFVPKAQADYESTSNNLASCQTG